MVAILLIATAVSLFTVGYCGNNTVTDEVWFDIEVKDLDGPGDHYRGRFTIAVFGESAPMTALNFVSLAKGHKKGGQKLHYKNTIIHRVVTDFVLQMGDVTQNNGLGGTSIYGDKFNDEAFVLSHRAPGMVAMANHGPDTNGSQFFILLTKARWLDGKHVVFGKVISGYEVLGTVGEVPTNPETASPKKRITIIDCGLNDLEKKYELTEEQMDSTEDL